MPTVRLERSRHSNEKGNTTISRAYVASKVPVYQHVQELFRHSKADSGVGLDDFDIYNAQDNSLRFADDRKIASSDPFAWQLESQLGARSQSIPVGGYCWSSEDTKHAIRSSERSQRIWENHFWDRGDGTQHFPPIQVMSAAHESKYERIAICTYPETYPRQQEQQETIVPRKYRLRPKKTKSTKAIPFVDKWSGQPPVSKRSTRATVPTIYSETTWPGPPRVQKYLNAQCLSFNPINLVPKVVQNLWPQNQSQNQPQNQQQYQPFAKAQILEPPDRYYDMGEELVYAMVNNRCQPLKTADGKFVCDRWSAWSPSEPVVQLEPSRRVVLRGACAEIVEWEKTKPGRYLSWTSQVDYSGYR